MERLFIQWDSIVNELLMRFIVQTMDLYYVAGTWYKVLLMRFIVQTMSWYTLCGRVGQVKMEHYFHSQQTIFLQIPHVLTLVNLHSNFVFNTCNISEDTFAFVRSVLSEKYVFS